MRERKNIDGALRDLFQQGRTVLVKILTRGVPVREALNVDLPKVQELRADLALLLEDGSILHVEFQSRNDRDMAYRMAMYHTLLARRYRRPLRSVLLYVGPEPMRMAARLETGAMSFGYDIFDMRDVSADQLLASGGTGDFALAVLAGDADEKLGEIVAGLARLAPGERERAAAQMTVLAGIRQLSVRLRMELQRMGVTIDIRDNVILQDIREAALREGEAIGESRGEARGEARGAARGKAEGKAEGEARGKAELLRTLLVSRFGRLPRWAEVRLQQAESRQIDAWAVKFVEAKKLDEVVPRR